jgi:nitrogen regulatory protein PII
MFGHLDIVQSVGLPETHKSLMDTSVDSLTARSVKCILIHAEPVNAIHVEISIVSKMMIVIMVSATDVKSL